MNKPVTGLVAAIGVAIVVTAFGLHPAVANSISAASTGGAHLEEAALGQK
jgi:hypothetical protein